MKSYLILKRMDKGDLFIKLKIHYIFTLNL